MTPDPFLPAQDTIDLQWVEVAVQHAICKSELRHMRPVMRELADQLVAGVAKKVLYQDSGDKRFVIATATCQSKVKPRWIPGFIWNRFQTETVSSSTAVEYQPRWLYPDNTIDIEHKVGSPVRFLVETPVDLKSYIREG